MKKLKQSMFWGLFILSSVLIFSGCANYISTENTRDTVIRRIPVKTETAITENMNSESVINVKGEQSVTESVVTEEVDNKYDIYTPYRGIRKLWEMPLGLLLFPASLIVTVADVGLFGLIPNRYTDELIDMSITGMNPCLNWENPERTEKILKSSVTKPIDTKIENILKPADNLDIYFVTDKGTPYRFKLDDNGQLKILLVKWMIENINSNDSLRYFDILIDNPKGKLSGRIVISRELDYKLRKAKNLVEELNKDSSPGKLADAILELEKSGFTEYALEIENEFKARNSSHEDYTTRFNLEINKHFKDLSK